MFGALKLPSRPGDLDLNLDFEITTLNTGTRDGLYHITLGSSIGHGGYFLCFAEEGVEGFKASPDQGGS